MSRGKILSLEEARDPENPGSTIEQFCKEHPSEADAGRFQRLMDAMIRKPEEAHQTSGAGLSEGCSGTRTHQDTSKDAGG